MDPAVERDRMMERRADMIMKRYRPYVEALEHSVVAKVRPISTFDVVALGEQLYQYQTYEGMLRIS